MSPAARAALEYVAGRSKKAWPKTTLYVRCNVNPGVSTGRVGVTGIDSGAVSVYVAAQARKGAGNRAVIDLLSEVLNLPKSGMYIRQGIKTRSKIVAVVGGWVNDGEEECLRRARECFRLALAAKAAEAKIVEAKAGVGAKTVEAKAVEKP